MRNWNQVVYWKISDHLFKYKNLGDRTRLSKNLSIGQCLGDQLFASAIIDLHATDKSQYFARHRPIIVHYCIKQHNDHASSVMWPWGGKMTSTLCKLTRYISVPKANSSVNVKGKQYTAYCSNRLRKYCALNTLTNWNSLHKYIIQQSKRHKAESVS